jgi:bifunctional NMN adenylyltransferase/nudix hydrolase
MPALDTAILIGSFEPLHVGHLAALTAALDAAKAVFVLIGSARAARSTRHPWTAAQREDMICACLDGAALARVSIAPLRDRLYDDASWQEGLRETVARNVVAGRRVGLIASDWSPAFPEWEPIAVAPVSVASGAQLRERYLAGEALEPDVPAGARAVLARLRAGPDFAGLEAEYRSVQAHRRAWNVAPYPVILVTVDAVVVQSGHLLLIRRGRQPGQGLWALPGGFLDPDETLLAGCLRELKEETGIKVATSELLARLRDQHVFDAPDRSVRGRTVTHAFYFELPPGPLPAVHGSDDAERAQWVPLARFLEMEEQVFEDHYHIVRLFIG